MTIEEYLQREREAEAAHEASEEQRPKDWGIFLQRDAVAAVEDPRLDAIVRMAVQLVQSYLPVEPNWYRGVGGLVTEAIRYHLENISKAQEQAQQRARIEADGLYAVMKEDMNPYLRSFKATLEEHDLDVRRRFLADLSRELT